MSRNSRHRSHALNTFAGTLSTCPTAAIQANGSASFNTSGSRKPWSNHAAFSAVLTVLQALSQPAAWLVAIRKILHAAQSQGGGAVLDRRDRLDAGRPYLASPEMRNRARNACGVEQPVNAAEMGAPSRHDKGQKLQRPWRHWCCPAWGQRFACNQATATDRPLMPSTHDADSYFFLHVPVGLTHQRPLSANGLAAYPDLCSNFRSSLTLWSGTRRRKPRPLAAPGPPPRSVKFRPPAPCQT
jgi:hypothetical protein